MLTAVYHTISSSMDDFRTILLVMMRSLVFFHLGGYLVVHILIFVRIS